MPDPINWVRVRDKGTGHEYDVAEGNVDEEIHEPLKAYPIHRSPDPRPAKHRVGKNGRAYAGPKDKPGTEMTPTTEEADRG